MIKVAALTSGKDVPSTRYRVRQHIAPLLDYGIKVQEHCPVINKYQSMPLWPKGIRSSYALPFHLIWQLTKLSTRLPGILSASRADVVWLQREMLPGYPTLEKFLKRPLLFDVDDAIWMSKPFGKKMAKAIALRSSYVIAGNEYIADWFSAYSHNIAIVPTAVDIDRYNTDRSEDFDGKFIVGWIGTSGNLKYLQEIESGIRKFLKEYKNSRLLVVCDKSPKFIRLGDEEVIYVPWSPENEVRMMQNMDVGLMPLANEPWASGKCSFKMLQYMSCGIPALVSPVGMNNEVLAKGEVGFSAESDHEWYEKLVDLKQNSELRNAIGKQGRKVVVHEYSRTVVSKKLANLMKLVVSN